MTRAPENTFDDESCGTVAVLMFSVTLPVVPPPVSPVPAVTPVIVPSRESLAFRKSNLSVGRDLEAGFDRRSCSRTEEQIQSTGCRSIVVADRFCLPSKVLIHRSTCTNIERRRREIQRL